MRQEPNAQFRLAAKSMKEVVEAYEEAGFTHEEALRLLLAQLTASMKPGE